jgi:hypothetical protein
MQILSTLQHLASAIFGGLALVAYFAWRAKRAWDVSEAEAAERKAARESFELLKRDPHFLRLHQYLQAKHYRTAFERAPDPATYCVRYIGLMDERYQRLFAHEGARARYLVAYLERRDAPARVQAQLDLRSGVCTDTEAAWMGWDGLIPLMY